MKVIPEIGTYHYAFTLDAMFREAAVDVPAFEYTFENFFHPFVGKLINQLNQTSIAGMLDPEFLKTCQEAYSPDDYGSVSPKVTLLDKDIDLTIGGPYANYNWELLYHIPVMIAVHLGNNQRFAEAQKWFHLVFDPTCTDSLVSPPERFWKFLAFRYAQSSDSDSPSYTDIQNINTLLTLLSTPDAELHNHPTQLKEKNAILRGYYDSIQNPFQPHVVARTRPGAYQWYVVMKYLDNLIAWGDSLFLQDTIETINEATLCYVLAANILGPRPQAMPQRGAIKPKNFLQLKQAGLDPMGNAMVELEGQFPFNLTPGPLQNNAVADQSSALFGIGRALYFCIPANQTLLAYWDTVADRLFKIRNSENIQGVVQQLPLFDPPLDPGMLVKAVAAGIDIGSVVSGLNQPLSPVRAPLLIQKALEIAGEVRALGNALLAALEKSDAERLALQRQVHEVQLQQMVQSVRYLQWKHTEETTNGLLKTHASALERYTYYLRLIGLTPDSNAVNLVRRDLNEGNFDAIYSELVGQYDQPVALQSYTQLQITGGSAPSNQSGATGAGPLYLNKNEDAELNTHLPLARNTRLDANTSYGDAATIALFPDFSINLEFLGLGGSSMAFGGSKFSDVAKIGAQSSLTTSAYEQDQAGIASRTASYQRRADEWMFQANLAARELMQIGRQIIASLISEQVSSHDYQAVKTQIQQAQDIQAFLEDKFTNTAFYDWQTSEITGLYYQYYRFACDVARKAEQTMKRELLRPELDSTQFIQFNYWDGGHKGLLSGEALVLDLKRMEMAYHDNNKRELELTRHVSMRQLDPLALFTLKSQGSCTFTVPEWLYDLDCPGLYMRRIKSVGLSVPCVVGPYTSINCTLSLQRSELRVSPLLRDGKYNKPDPLSEDDRFVEYFGAADAIVTSSAVNDSGMFETNLKDERFLPFEGAGAISTWTLSLPQQLKTFDYMTISDVILHIRYTARQAGNPLGSQATSELTKSLKGTSSLALMFCLRFDFPTEWSSFVNGTANFVATLRKVHFPYLAQSATNLGINSLTLLAASGDPQTVDLATSFPGDINIDGTAVLTLPVGSVLTRDASKQVFLLLQYSLTV